ncbi:MAG: hypothetical protein RL220_525, partial [Bacteroidota bacterium]
SIKTDLGKKHDYVTPKGEKIQVEVVDQPLRTYSDDFISFKYDKTLSASQINVGSGIDQVMVMKASGSGVLVQEYRTMDPTMLIDLMMDEMTKESVSYGYTRKDKDVKIKLDSGITLEGKRSTLTYQGSDEEYTVLSYGGKDNGLLVITMLLNDDFAEEDQKLIDTFYETLKLTE